MNGAQRAAIAAAVLVVAVGVQAHAQPPSQRRFAPPPPSAATASPTPAATTTTGTPSGDLRSRFGMEVAKRLMRSLDADERLRGMERAAAMDSPEGLALLLRAAGGGTGGAFDASLPQEGVGRTDPRALLVVVRGLAAHLDKDAARLALAQLLSAPAAMFMTRTPSLGARDPAAEDTDGAARNQLARQQAAIALASSGNAVAMDRLVDTARSGGPGQAPALEAIRMMPPSAPKLGRIEVTTPEMVTLAAEIGDLRTLDAIEGATKASDAGLRAAAIAALGTMGDQRAVEIARAAAHDQDPRVRVACAEALVRLGAADAAPLIEVLVADDTTAAGALRLARELATEGVTKAAAARAAASADPTLRQAAVGALGRQTSVSAVRVLLTLATDPALQGDAAFALARSPAPGAMAALETLAAAPATRRVAARAYFVRRFVRGERSGSLDGLLASMAASSEARDRAVAVEALVALGERALDQALGDADARVRRGAAMGAAAHLDAQARATLLARLAVERDAATRTVLALGLGGGDPTGVVPTRELVERAEEGGPDASLAALALARRADDDLGPKVDALLASRDPLVRAYVARGLASSDARDATGRLARAYTWEADELVRRALVTALAARAADAGAPARRDALELAARLDPDGTARWTAQQALARQTLAGPTAAARAAVHEVAWLRVVPAEGATLPHEALGVLADDAGLAVPVVFDEDGYALVPGVAPGQARLRLAPRLPAYEAAAP
jgi:HEAT repeat protein